MHKEQQQQQQKTADSVINIDKEKTIKQYETKINSYEIVCRRLEKRRKFQVKFIPILKCIEEYFNKNKSIFMWFQIKEYSLASFFVSLSVKCLENFQEQ